MNIYTWVFTGLLVVTLVLYIVAQARRFFVLEKIVRCLFIPFIMGIIASLLTEYLPDSYHILLLFTIALSADSLALICTVGDKKKVFKFFSIFLFLFSCAIWTNLLFSVYRIFKIKEFVYIIIGAVYFAGFVTVCFFIKKQPASKYVAAFFQYFICAFLSLTAFVSIFYERRVFDILMFIGTLCIMCRSIFQIFQITKPFDITPRVEKTIITLLAVAGNAIMGAGAILMQI